MLLASVERVSTGGFFLLSLWPLIVLGLSLVVRKRQGRPVAFFGVPGALFQERSVSGACQDKWWRRFAVANRCLVVAVTADRLVVRPWTPFNWMFFPDIFALEHDVNLTDIISVRRRRRFGREVVDLRFRALGGERQLWLAVSDVETFCAAVGGAGILIRSAGQP